MGIVTKSDERIRDEVLSYLASKRRTVPNFKVLDVGGAAKPWCDEFVDAYVDIVPVKTDKRVFLGDINSSEIWKAISRERWDFSICTHVLEDIRRPDFVLSKLMEVSKAGFIAVPNKHTEFVHVESLFWVGYCHHRWIFSVSEDDKLLIIAKFPIVNYFSRTNFIWHWLSSVPFLHKVQRRLSLRPALPALPWLNRSKAKHNLELGFIWEGSFPYEFVNDDFAGQNDLELAALYYNALEDGI
jgi:hypothetical protein